MPRKKWSREIVVASIQKIHQSGGKLNSGHLQRHQMKLYKAAVRYFGGWKEALCSAGIDPITVPNPLKKWTKERIREEILVLHGKGTPLNYNALRKSGRGNLVSAALFVFGSWRKAIRFSGLRYASVRQLRYLWWTPSRVLYAIKRLERAGVRLSTKAVSQSRHRGLLGVASYYFGSWGQAVEAAGYDYALHCEKWSSKAWVCKLTNDDLIKIDRQSLKMSKIRGRR